MSLDHPIPFAIQLGRLHRRDFVFEHEVTFGVARAKEQACVVIESKRYDDPRIVERLSKGGLELADSHVDQLALLCFRLLADQMRNRVGESGWMTVADIRPEICGNFASAAAATVLQALKPLVVAGSILSLCAVEGDDPI